MPTLTQTKHLKNDIATISKQGQDGYVLKLRPTGDRKTISLLHTPEINKVKELLEDFRDEKNYSTQERKLAIDCHNMDFVSAECMSMLVKATRAFDLSGDTLILADMDPSLTETIRAFKMDKKLHCFPHHTAKESLSSQEKGLWR